MNSNNRNRKNQNRRNKRPAPRARRNALSNTDGRYVSIPNVRCLYPPLPREFQVKLRYNEEIRVTSSISPFFDKFGLFAFLSQRPLYCTSLYEIYKYAMITAVTVRVEVLNLGTTPTITAMAAVPFDEATTSNIGNADLLARYPRSVSKTTAPLSGIGKSVLTRTYHSYEELGQPVYDRSHWQTATDAVSATPINTSDPIVFVMTNESNGGTWSGHVRYTVDYHIKFFEHHFDFLALQDKPEPMMQEFVKPEPMMQEFIPVSNRLIRR